MIPRPRAIPPAASGPLRRLLLFGKPPVPGRAKTRLAPLLGARGAAELYRAFLEDTIRSAASLTGVEVELWLDVRGGGRRRLESPLEGADLRVRRQRGADLGARLGRAFDRAFGEGTERALAVGTDHPTLPPELMADAFEALDDAEAACGPTGDGGYWGLALRRDAWPRAARLFRGIPWSTVRVLEETRARATAAGLRWRELPAWYDVDDPGDLERLREDVRPGTRTAELLARLDPRSDREVGPAEAG